MNKCIDDNLTDLNIISLLTEGVKLSVRNGRISHELPKGENIVANAAGSAKRWFFNDNRRSGVGEVYSVIKQTLVIMKDMLVPGAFYYNKYVDILPRVIEGIENYKTTYKDDTFITSRCNVIVDAIHSVLHQRQGFDESPKRRKGQDVVTPMKP